MRRLSKMRYFDYIMIIIGTGLMALAINAVFEPAGLVTGGFSGLAIIVKHVTEGLWEQGIPVWVTTVTLNLPLFLFSFKIQGKKGFLKSILGMVSLSTWLSLIPPISLVPDDLLLTAVYGAVFQGVGIGMVFIGHGTTGGTDLLASLMQRKLRHYTIAQIMQVLDGIVVVVGAYVFGITRALYAVIAIVVITKVSDALIEGLHFSKVVYIITEKPDELSRAIMHKVNRGVTGLTAKGMYTGSDRTMLYCVVGKKQIVQLKDIVMELDQNAFVIVTDAREVLGEGFIETV